MPRLTPMLASISEPGVGHLRAGVIRTVRGAVVHEEPALLLGGGANEVFDPGLSCSQEPPMASQWGASLEVP